MPDTFFISAKVSVCLSRADEFDLDLSIKCKEITDENATLVSFRFFKERHLLLPCNRIGNSILVFPALVMLNPYP